MTKNIRSKDHSCQSVPDQELAENKTNFVTSILNLSLAQNFDSLPLVTLRQSKSINYRDEIEHAEPEGDLEHNRLPN